MKIITKKVEMLLHISTFLFYKIRDKMIDNASS